MNNNYNTELLNRAQKIQILLLDVDGVLTDGTLHYSGEQTEAKDFHTQDGFGLHLLKEAGIATGIITARKSTVVTRRANELAMQYLHQGTHNKRDALQEIITTSGISAESIAYMGDDWLDLPLLNRVGLAAAPSNAIAEVQAAAHHVTLLPGGKGAVRELCNLLLIAHGVYDSLFARYNN